MSVGSVRESISIDFYAAVRKQTAGSAAVVTADGSAVQIVQPIMVSQIEDQSRFRAFINKLDTLEGPFLTKGERAESMRKLTGLVWNLISKIDQEFAGYKKNEKVIEKYIFSLEMMEAAGYRLIELSKNNLIMKDYNDDVLDCDSRNFVLLALAEHYGWEAGLISLPQHSVFYTQQGAAVDYDADRDKILVVEDMNYYVDRLSLPKEKLNDIFIVNAGENVFTETYANIGVYLYKSKRHSEALPYLNKAIGNYPGNGSWRYLRGNIHYDARRYPEALQDYQAATELQPSDNEAWYNLGSTLFIMKRYQEAKSALERAVKINPQDQYLELLRKVNRMIE